MIIETLAMGPLETNCYVVAAGPKTAAVIIDPGQDTDRIKAVLDKHRLTPQMVVNTHGHYDHIGGDDAFGVPVYIHEQDQVALLDAKQNFSVFFDTAFKVKSPIRVLHDGQCLRADGLELVVLHIPGHSAGGIALVVTAPQPGHVFTGDSLFAGSIGRTDLGGSEEQLIEGIKSKLFALPDQTVVYPGHGPATTIGAERLHNPFLR